MDTSGMTNDPNAAASSTNAITITAANTSGPRECMCSVKS